MMPSTDAAHDDGWGRPHGRAPDRQAEVDWPIQLPEPSTLLSNSSFANGIDVRRFTHGSYRLDEAPGGNGHLFAYRVAGTTRAERTAGGRTARAVTRRGSITIVPAHQTSSWSIQGAGQLLYVLLPEALLRGIADELDASRGVVLVERLGVLDPRLSDVANGLLTEMGQGLAGSALFAEALVVQLAVRLVRDHSAAATKASTSRGCLGPLKRRRLEEYIDSNLGRKLTLGELAEVAGWSLSHFTASFRQSFGVSAHQYVLRRRAERARSLLLATDDSIARIAALTGFADQAHLTRVFKRSCHSTPAACRAAAAA